MRGSRVRSAHSTMAANTKNIELGALLGRLSLTVALSAVVVAGCGVSDPGLLPDDDSGLDAAVDRRDSGNQPPVGEASMDSGGALDAATDGAGSMDVSAVVDAVDGGAPPGRDGPTDAGVADGNASDVCTRNACGGCSALSGAPGGACGQCGQYACDNATGTLKCNDPGQNACMGCGALNAMPGVTCGTCGKYVCNAGKTAVTCDDPALTNMCPTWCTAHPAPAGVAASDYQCIDFDNAMAPPATWPVTATGMGTVARTNARASSPSYSLLSSITAAHEDAGTIAWNDVGATPITSLSVSAAMSPTTPGGVFPPSNGGMDVLCVASGGNRTCLDYTVNGNGANFTGLYVYWSFVGGAAVAGQCPLTVTNLTPNIWSIVTLSIDVATHVIVVTINGTTVTSSCSGQIASDTVAKVTVGATTHSFNNFSWAGYYDNVQATIRR